MKDIIDAMPEGVAPELELERVHEDSPVLPPDDDDVIRPEAEEDLGRLGEDGSLVGVGNAPLAKHLLWTFGPHHRDFPFMLQLRVEVEGDRLVSVDPEIGWLHQGLEKALEQVAYHRALDLLPRLSPRGPAAYTLAWILALERHLGVVEQVPARAQLWRVIVLELTRIAEHLQVLSSLVLAHSERRSQRVFFDAARRVQTLLDLAARHDGQPLLRALGGLAAPIPTSVPETLEKQLTAALHPIQPTGDRLWQNPAFLDSLVGLGVIERAQALSSGYSGPALRACGLGDDVRKSDPYFAYGRIKPRVPVHVGGDSLARFAVRLDEVAASSALVLRALAAFQQEDPATSAVLEVPRDDEGRLRPPPGTTAVSVELASGELSLLLVSDGGPTPLRARIRGPSFPLVASLPRLLEGSRIDDVVPILRSLGINAHELDR